MEKMTDKQLNFIVPLVIDKLECCKNMEEIKKVFGVITSMLKKERRLTTSE